jgi:hypothetical protein
MLGTFPAFIYVLSWLPVLLISPNSTSVHSRFVCHPPPPPVHPSFSHGPGLSVLHRPCLLKEEQMSGWAKEAGSEWGPGSHSGQCSDPYGYMKQGMWQKMALTSPSPAAASHTLTTPLFNQYFLKLLMLYLGYMVRFVQMLTIYHSWIHPSIIFLYPLPHSQNSFNRSHFSIFIHECLIFHHIHLPTLFPYILPLPLVPTPRQDLLYLPVLHFLKKTV